MTDDQFRCTLPWPGKPKARPIVTKNGTHMPDDYVEWKENVAEYLRYFPGMIEGPVMIELEFSEKKVNVSVIPVVGEFQRDKHVRGDLDNLIGGVMDAMQDAGTIVNDSQVVAVRASIRNRVGRSESILPVTITAEVQRRD